MGHLAGREVRTVSGDICPGPDQLLIRLDPPAAPRRAKALAALCNQLSAAGAATPAPVSSCAAESRTTPALYDSLLSVQSSLARLPSRSTKDLCCASIKHLWE